MAAPAQIMPSRSHSSGLLDGLHLSQRIWRLDQGGMQAIRNTIATGMAQRTSAVELAQQLEGQLNAGEDWPRWTRARLSQMDAAERAQDAKGLLRSASDVPPGGSSGISYNALRLARNEIQIANHAVTSDIAIHSPWVTGRKVAFSPAHPRATSATSMQPADHTRRPPTSCRCIRSACAGGKRCLCRPATSPNRCGAG